MVAKKNGGWTLIEMIIVSAIIGITAMVAPRMIKSATQFFILSKARLELQREARAAMYLITRELRQAQSDTILIDQVTNQPYYSRMSFTKIQGTAVTFKQQGSSLLLQHGIQISTMTRNLSFLSFSFPQSDDMTIVSVAITLQQKIYGGDIKALHMASEKVRVMN